ncbi:MAG: PucR family transcriptional regulator [Solirubrobacteraceae bacterium]
MPLARSDSEQQVQEQLTAVLSRLPPEELGEAMAGELLRAIPEIQRSTDEDFRGALIRSCVSNVAAAFDALLSGAQDAPLSVPAEASAFAHELVHRGLELAPLLRSYRLGQWYVHTRVERMAAELELESELRWRVLTRVSDYMFKYVDTISSELVDDYEREHAQWIRGAAAARAELIGAMLAGKEVDPRAATEKLRYDVSRRHLAMIVWADGRHATLDPGSLEPAAAALARGLGGGPVLTIAIGERVVWAWTSGGAGLGDDPPADAAPALAAGLRAAVGMPAEGPAGMVSSHLQALEARRVAELLAAPEDAVVGYRATALSALLTAAPRLAVDFAEAELGALTDGGETTERLRETLSVYLEENLSAMRTARRLHVHQNTVVYRVKRAEEILGRGIEQRRLELEVALRLADGLEALRAARDLS